MRVTGGVPAEKQIALALFLASERSNHISGKLIHVNDDWKRFEQDNMKPETLHAAAGAEDLKADGTAPSEALQRSKRLKRLAQRVLGAAAAAGFAARVRRILRTCRARC